MKRSRRRSPAARYGGFSLLELCLAIGVFIVLAGVLLNALLYSQELAEKTAVDLTLRNIRSGIRFQIADKMIHGRDAELEQVLSANPVNWLEKPPPGYVGELGGRAAASLRPGEWFYDAERHELGYVPRLSFHLDVRGETVHALRWRVHGLKSARGDIEDLALVSTTSYTWF